MSSSRGERGNFVVTFLSTRRRHPLAAFAVMSVGLITFGLVYAAFSPSTEAHASAAQSLAIEEGQKLYLVGCATCHGLNAEGGSVGAEQAGPSLVGVGAAAVDFQVATGRMPLAGQAAQAPEKPPLYDRAQIDQLSAYIASLGPGPAVPAPEDYAYEDANLAEGGELFRTNCASCHNFAGQGGALTDAKYAPPIVGTAPKYIVEAMLTGPQSMPVFSNSTLTLEDKQAIIKYVVALEEAPDTGGAGIGRIGPVSEGLWGWILGMGSLVGVAVWVGAKSR